MERWIENIPIRTYMEGDTIFWIPDTENIYEAPAFFNPAMGLNRDLAILSVKLLSNIRKRKIRFFEPLAGIGARGVRLVNEANEAIEESVINDFGEISTKLAAFNRGKLKDNRLIQFKREARALMLELAENKFKYQMIDLDPFGSPAPFIDFIWSLLARNGIVSVTATDMTALAGVFPKACLRKYGAYPLNNERTHETAIRIVIGLVARSAARQERGIKPLLSVSTDHYVKIFLQVQEGRGKANESVSRLGNVFFCQQCQWVGFEYPQRHTKHGKLLKAGELWKGELFDQNWNRQLLELLPNVNLHATKRIEKILNEAIYAHDIPYYYAIEEISSYLHVNTPKSKKIVEDLHSLGFKACKTTFRKQAIRTNAPLWIIEKIVRKDT